MNNDLNQAVDRLQGNGAKLRAVTRVRRALLALAVLLLVMALGVYALGPGAQAAWPISLLGSACGFAALGLGLWSARRLSA